MQQHHRQLIEDTLYRMQRIQPAELAPVLASRYERLTFAVAREELQALADTLSRLSVAVSGFIMADDWQRQENHAAEETRRNTNAATGARRLTVAEVAQRLSITPAKVYKMIEAGQLPAHNLNEKSTNQRACWRVWETDLPT
ncbi:helix-turn-helix domain-containing protein [Hymenobacter latericus]|uniref:helix-turn-helix domain-containing protein n=1 Tax=Hymenobacter sp. YIM 151858-1 TaxID=2987688 RepID=UPI002225CCEA|nr:helix-turn-helix domain-containing protein [Hymenobacter sp. YIM 151858-1]UYZ59551.1 helix-turn-helix domain-containing protein [Hymenobacter sp. YIM 151858-1]